MRDIFFFSSEFSIVKRENVDADSDSNWNDNSFRCKMRYFWKLVESDVSLNLSEENNQNFLENLILSSLNLKFNRAWSQRSDLKCIKSSFSSMIILCLLIQSFSRMIKWLSIFVMNIEIDSSLWFWIVSEKNMTWVTNFALMSSNLLKCFSRSSFIDIICNISQMFSTIFSFTKTYSEFQNRIKKLFNIFESQSLRYRIWLENFLQIYWKYWRVMRSSICVMNFLSRFRKETLVFWLKSHFEIEFANLASVFVLFRRFDFHIRHQKYFQLVYFDDF